MSQAVYVGGFLSGRSSAEGVRSALGSYFEDVEAFTFSDYVRNPEKVRRALKGNFAVTHSSGALALDPISTKPEQALILNPPLPTRIGRLVAKSLIIAKDILWPSAGITFCEVNKLLQSGGGELIAHSRANLSQVREISRFNAIETAIGMGNLGVTATLVWTIDDAFFQPTDLQKDQAAEAHVPVVVLPGVHDEVMLHPQHFIGQLLNV